MQMCARRAESPRKAHDLPRSDELAFRGFARVPKIGVGQAANAGDHEGGPRSVTPDRLFQGAPKICPWRKPDGQELHGGQ